MVRYVCVYQHRLTRFLLFKYFVKTGFLFLVLYLIFIFSAEWHIKLALRLFSYQNDKLGYTKLFSINDFSYFLLLYFTEIDTQNVSGYTVATTYMNNLSISAAEMTQYYPTLEWVTQIVLQKTTVCHTFHMC